MCDDLDVGDAVAVTVTVKGGEVVVGVGGCSTSIVKPTSDTATRHGEQKYIVLCLDMSAYPLPAKGSAGEL
jgi:hypothetical protein